MFTRICKNTDLPIPVRITGHRFFRRLRHHRFLFKPLHPEPIYFGILWDRPHAAQASAEKLCGHAGTSFLCTSGVTEVYRGRLPQKAAQQGHRQVETGGVPSVGYVEDFDELRTMLADFFSILLLDFSHVHLSDSFCRDAERSQ